MLFGARKMGFYVLIKIPVGFKNKKQEDCCSFKKPKVFNINFRSFNYLSQTYDEYFWTVF